MLFGSVLGLADGLGSVDSVARDVLNTEAVLDFSEYSPWQQFMRQVGAETLSGAWDRLQMRLQDEKPAMR